MALLFATSSFAADSLKNTNLLNKAPTNNLLAGPFSNCVAYCVELQGGLCRFAPDPEACFVGQRACVQECLGI